MTILARIRRLMRNRSGVAMTEFAIGAPFLLTAGLWGAELANFALVNMKVGQLAVHFADNASRIGDTATLQDRKIYEGDINDLIFGAQLQAGKSLGFYDHGRVIISSVEVDSNGLQYIHWQRCRGLRPYNSSYGAEGTRLGTGMGPAGEEVSAEPDDAVIFVEVTYDYQPLISARFVGNPKIRSISSFTVRDDRDLSQIYQRDPNNPDPVQRCNQYTGTPAVGAGGRVS